MRKLVFLPIVTAVFLADFGAFGATARSSRGNATNAGNNATVTSAPVSARAAVRGAKTVQQNVTAPVSARAATRNTPKTTTNVAPNVKTVANNAVAARAGAKQKVVNMGTKIANATANTVVSQECQDAYFGCMDSFCMLENVTGGRCKCSDKNIEYDDILAKIMNLDQQSYVMQTEGVALLKMGKSADEVYAMAEDAANKVSRDKKAEGQADDKKLNVSAWDSSLFEDDEELFVEDSVVLDSDLTSKTGDKLHAIAASICTQQVPKQCSASVPMLRMIYVQKIQSDCAAYENSLKQQQLESNQKLQTARQSLRDTALEKYQEANKYDLGGCVRAFSTCMQQDEVCGEGFLGCVTFAAMDNLKNDTAGTVAEQTTIKFTYSSISLAKTTMDELLSKRVYCDSVLDQCVNANVDNAVWNAFLKSEAPAIKTAESDAENSLRMNCVKEVSDCFRTGCKEQLDVNSETGSYDMCLANPDLYKSLCKPKLEPCLIATGGTYDDPQSSSLWTALLARLASMKVDACTTEVKGCLLSEDRCGKDYTGCIGLTTYDIGELCPTDKLTACRDERKGLSGDALEKDIREYVNTVAQGIALNIDNSMLTQCQSALKTAMLTHCGAEEASCPNARVDESLFKGGMRVELCLDEDCSPNPNHFTNTQLIKEDITPQLLGKVDITRIYYDPDAKDGEHFKMDSSVEDNKKDDYTYDSAALKRLQRTLESAYKNMVSAIEADPKVQYCISGRDTVQGWAAGSNLSTSTTGRFPKLTQSARDAVAQQLINSVFSIYSEEYEKVLSDQLASVTQQLSNAINEIVQVTAEKQHTINTTACNTMADGGSEPSCHGCTHIETLRQPTYDKDTWMCTVAITQWKKSSDICGCGASFTKREWKEYFAMPQITRVGLRDYNGQNITNATTNQDYMEQHGTIKKNW